MDPTRWPHAPNALALIRQKSHDLRKNPGLRRMKLIAGLLSAAVLAVASGCAKTDWIDRTLVTVDVTGTWHGAVGTGAGSRELLLEVDQQGPTVTGFARSIMGGGQRTSTIQGTVTGDVFRLANDRGSVEGELTVSGDEMTGQMSWPILGNAPVLLRRVDPSSLPASRPR
jgi:hypothetical protein